ncbi:MAG: O-antigen ligase family protein [Pyrinomonadaceae bacterium]|nr:O-antigen ligase family protein [Pyrinomonadaceae bacterium]
MANTASRTNKFDLAKRFTVVCAFILGACALGYGMVVAGDGPSSKIVGIGVLLSVALGGAAAILFELPWILAIRYAFIGSFFFKGDLSLFKINEVEDPSGLNLSLTLFTAVILIAYDHFADGDRESVLPSAFLYLAGGLFICAAASILLAGPTLLGGFSLLSVLTSILIAYAVASHFGTRERLIELTIGIAVGVLFTGVVALSQFALDFPSNLPNFGTGTDEELLGTQAELLSRVPAFLRTPTEMAWVMSSLIPIVLTPLLCRVKSFGSYQKTLLAIGALAGTIAVILSLARGSWVGIIAAIPLMIVFGWFRLSAHEKKPYFVSVATAIFLTCLMLSPFAGKIYDRLTEDDQGSAQIRLPLMETALRMIDDNPLVGVGLNSYRANMTRYDETAIFVSQVFPNPVHNIFAHITAEIGIPGGILFCLLILYSIYECYRSSSSSDRLLYALSIGLAAGMIAFVISGTKEPGSLGSVRPPVRTCFFMFGTIFALSRVVRRSNLLAER